MFLPWQSRKGRPPLPERSSARCRGVGGAPQLSRSNGSGARLTLLRPYAGRLAGASVSPAFEFASRFARTIILSRFLTQADLGAAVMLVTLLASCEFLTDVGLEPFVVVHAGLNRGQAVAAARQIAIARGVLMALLIVLLAPLLADLFDARANVDSIRWLSLVPLVKGFRNLRTVQIQSEYRYRPEAMSKVVADLAALVMVLPAVAWFHDERAMLASLIVEAGLYDIISHFAIPAERVGPVDPAVRWAAVAFGLPLMANGIGLVMLSQFDRMIVSNLFGLETLAQYSVVFNLANAPISLFMMTFGRVLVPFLGRSRDDPAKLRRISLTVVCGVFAIAASYALAAGVLLDVVVPLLYGQQYQVSSGIHALVTLIVFLRFCRNGLSGFFLVHSETGRLTRANLLSGIGLVIGLVLGVFYHRVEGLMIGLLIGDTLSLFALLKLSSPRLPIRATLHHLILLSFPAALAAIGALAGDDIKIRALIVAASGVVIGLDVVTAYLSSCRTIEGIHRN
jgi:O-antigen/teichoic acid export membrane protein